MQNKASNSVSAGSPVEIASGEDEGDLPSLPPPIFIKYETHSNVWTEDLNGSDSARLDNGEN
jgi:hypothetical protein